jgi:hypothetical protein
MWLLLVILIIVLIVAVSKGNKKKNLEIEKLKTEVYAPNPSLSTADEIKKLKDLLDTNIITEEEFKEQRNKLLSK